MNVRENILLPYFVNRALRYSPSVREAAEALAHSVELSDKLTRNVKRLSQGERQRVALCRALLPNPCLILADEPTGNLDPASKNRIMSLLHSHARRLQATLIMVTHDRELLREMDAVHDFETLNTLGW